ncbi:MAG: sigma-54 dependent transcriptional regulator [Treponemataceae bacterium]
MNAVLHIDDREEELQELRYLLADRYRVTTCRKARYAASLIAKRKPDAVLLDIDMPDYDGFRVLSEIQAMDDPPPVLMLSGHPEPFFVRRAMREGAVDFISKPYTGSMIRHRLERILVGGNQSPITIPGTVPNEAAHILVGSSAAMSAVRTTLARYARSDAPVLILGESGTGKDKAAYVIHALSARAAGPFEIRNVGAFPESIVESELFGCEPGAFTGARASQGCFEAAHGGTLFLDEIADAGPTLQAALLRVVEDGQVRRLGSTKYKKADCRLVFATNCDLEEMVVHKKFRQDLLFRINTLPLIMPPLRERIEDIPELVELFLAQNGQSMETIKSDAMNSLFQHPWPGNVRQLKACVERALVLAADDPIGTEHLRP